jgi:aspartate dehydrogenase
MKIGIIGCGNIGTELALFIDDNPEHFKLTYLCDIDNTKIITLTALLRNNSPTVSPHSELIDRSEFIIESAGTEVVNKIFNSGTLDQHGKQLLIMSTGGLIRNLDSLGTLKHTQIHLPSGAISGLDAIKAVSGRIESLTLTTTKSAQGWEDAPYIIENNIQLKQINNRKTIFRGTLKDAIEGFPKNINVAATLFLASGFDDMKITIVVDPKSEFNVHEIEATGSFGEIKTTTQNTPSKNPKTSYLAVLSAMSVLKNCTSNVKMGH